MQLIVNGEAREYLGEPKLGNFLASIDLPSKMVVVELNGEIARRETYDEMPLRDGDQLEIVQMMAGG